MLCEFCEELEGDILLRGKPICQRCYDHIVPICAGCRRRITDESKIKVQTIATMGSISIVLCEECYSRGLNICRECGYIIRDSSYYLPEYYMCTRCLADKYIMDHGVSPDIINFLPKYKQGVLYLGIELELIHREYKRGLLTWIDIYKNNTRKIWMNYDSSVPGVEIISHPATLQYHKNFFGWNRILRKLRDAGCESETTGLCGLHVHMSSEYFDSEYDRTGEDSYERNIRKLVYFVSYNRDEIMEISRRSEEKLNRWAKIPKCKPLSEIDLDREARKYNAINIDRGDTVELRIFNGTLNYSDFIMSIEFADALARFIWNAEYNEKGLTWEEFVDFVGWRDANYILLPKYLYR